jgi:eukaryotic-like serine/threonine-protein kinase
VIESLGGYRLVRKVGDGPRAEVFLAHPVRTADDVHPAVIKIFRTDVTEQSIMVEIEALSRSSGAHTVELLDLATAPDGRPALILARCTNGSLAKLTRERSAFRPGESTTILAPLTSAVKRLHDQGVAHGAIRPDAVLFDGAGSPTLGCFGGARILAAGMPAATREAEPAFSADLDAVKGLAMIVLGRVRDDDTIAALEWLSRSDPSASGWLDALDERLFTLGEPVAVDLRPNAMTVTAAVPSRTAKAEPIASPPSPIVIAGLAIPEVFARFVSPRLLSAGLFDRLRASASSIRLRFWVAGCAVLVALCAAILLIPQEKSDAIQASQGAASSAATEQPPNSGPIEGDDPAAAAVQLLVAREACIRDMSVLCLDGVVQPDSAASTADRDLIRNIQDGQEVPAPWRVDTDSVVVDERLGDSAMVTLGSGTDSEPASLLLMKSEAGWRIRDYLG